MARRGRSEIAVLLVALVAAVAIGGGFVLFLAGASSGGRFDESTAITARDGVPVVLHARCGESSPIGRLEIREVTPGWQRPTDADPVIFAATTSGPGTAELAVVPEVEGYEVTTASRLEAGRRYYVSSLWGTTANEMAVAADFAPDELREGIAHPLVGPDLSEGGPDVAVADWYGTTTCP